MLWKVGIEIPDQIFKYHMVRDPNLGCSQNSAENFLSSWQRHRIFFYPDSESGYEIDILLHMGQVIAIFIPFKAYYKFKAYT